jgi:hypothetical protein
VLDGTRRGFDRLCVSAMARVRLRQDTERTGDGQHLTRIDHRYGDPAVLLMDPAL